MVCLDEGKLSLLTLGPHLIILWFVVPLLTCNMSPNKYRFFYIFFFIFLFFFKIKYVYWYFYTGQHDSYKHTSMITTTHLSVIHTTHTHIQTWFTQHKNTYTHDSYITYKHDSHNTYTHTPMIHTTHKKYTHEYTLQSNFSIILCMFWIFLSGKLVHDSYIFKRRFNSSL